MMGCLWSLFFENSGVDPDGSKKSGTNCPLSAGTGGNPENKAKLT
jgi:hypothetical protein